MNTGAFDPAREVARRTREAGAWLHVDGAFGLWAAASPRYRHLTDGFELADSWSTDGHKWPNVGYDCGIALVREPGHLRAAMASSSAYFVPTEAQGRRFTPRDVASGARSRVVGALCSLGRGLADLIDRTCAHARRFADGCAPRARF